MKTILVADDEANLRTLVHTTLAGPERRILEAADGPEALAVARRERPDLVVLDWMMPGMTGPEVARALRSEPATARIAIVMLTAKGGDTDRAVERELGLHCWLVKPFSPLELRALVEQALAGVDHRALPAAAGATDPSPDVLRELDMASSQLALFARDLRATLEAERRKSEELAAAHERLRILDRLKSDFLSFISHELRTPLAHLSVLSMLDANADPAEQEELIAIVREGYDRFERLIARGIEYLELRGSTPIEAASTCDLRAVVEAVVDDMGPAARGRVTVTTGPGAAPLTLRGDDDHLARIARTLIGNALESSGAEQTVAVEIHASEDGVVLAVTDRGGGFPPELAREIVEPFTIADILHHSRGTGLDLATANAIAGLLGGRIRAHSAGPGTGATFRVELPAASEASRLP